MAEQLQSRTGNSVMLRWGAGRTPLRWRTGSSGGRRTFEDDLALFELQVRDEARRRDPSSRGIGTHSEERTPCAF